MNLAIAHEMLVKLGGAERVIKTLSDCHPKAPIYTLFHDKKRTDDWFRDQKIHPSRLQKWYKLGIRPKYLLTGMGKAVEQWDFSRYDVVISSSSAFMHGIKTGKNTRHICYCHSPMRYAWDFVHEYTKNFSPFMKFLIAQKMNNIRQWDYLAADRPDVLIANSRHVQKRIQKYWRREAKVIYPPVDVKRFTPAKHHEDYFLIVSALSPFKRLDLAIHTFNKINRKLIIIGEGSQKAYLQSIAKSNIEFLGYKDDHTTRDYLENCRALIFPGEEDFGITPVEAMSAGKPVLAYGVGGVTESVVAGVSGEFFTRPTPQSLEDGLARLLANENTYDIQKIRSIAERFDKGVFVEKMKEIIGK
ncbi:glycosyltransferase [Patescibacteria group bacterium]|nr:glycosyltransferase [Patescibacteria group bacterium]